MEDIKIKPIEDSDKGWVLEMLEKEWGSPDIVSRGKSYHADKLPGFVALLNNERVGFITYNIENDCEIISINSFVENKGVGSKLIEKVKEIANEKGCKRVWMITTNDNFNALRFYQKRGFTLSALYPNALKMSRKLKPEIPMTGTDGIPLRDEIELEIKVT